MNTLYSKVIIKEDGKPVTYMEVSGDSTETKPTGDIADGSIFVESNTGTISLYNELSSDWVEQFSLQT